MNWVRENKFMTGFIAVMAIGVGVLGYLLYSAYGEYSDVGEQYTGQASQLHSLQSQAPYPDTANLKAYQAERDKVIEATRTLAASLAQMQLPVAQLSPAQFQDRLRTSVSNVLSKAQQTGVKLPDHFYMGFDVYQTQPPRAEAAAALGHQLAAMEMALNMVLDGRVDSVISLERTPLPEEEGGSRQPGGGGQGFGRNRGEEGGGGGGGGGRLVENVPFTIEYSATQSNFQKVLNSFAASTTQFFIVRTLRVENGDPKPLLKAEAEATPAPSAAPSPSAAAAGSASPAPGASAPSPTPEGFLKFIVGTEKLTVRMQVEIATFHPPTEAARKGAAAH